MTKKVFAIILIIMTWLSMTGFRPISGSVAVDASMVSAVTTFSKLAPPNGDYTQPTSGVVLQWSSLSGQNVTYQYCLWPRVKNHCPTSKWVNVGTNTNATLQNLLPNTTYYWTVRARAGSGSWVYADNGTWWNFQTLFSFPSTFSKIGPTNNAFNQPLTLTLSWGSSSGYKLHYEYCYSVANPGDYSPCTATWYRTNSTSVTIYGLQYAQTYKWQVRAVNVSGVMEANSGAVWQFTTIGAPPLPFGKLGPTSGSLVEPTNLTLSWSNSISATEYDYCISATYAGTCIFSGASVNASTSVTLNLSYGHIYYWQVTSKNTNGSVSANNGTWWTFTTIDGLPSNFNKISPIDGAANQSLTPSLDWWSPESANTTYSYCIDADPTCSSGNWLSVVQNTPITPTLNYGQTYYWQIKADNGIGTTYADDIAWSFTTLQAPPTWDPQSFSVDEGKQLNGLLQATSAYTNLTYSVVDALPVGQLALQGDGNFTYTPPANFQGGVSFKFMVSDGYNPPAGPFQVNITVNAINNPPVLDPLPGDQCVVNTSSQCMVSQGDLLVLVITGDDPDLPYGQTLSYSITSPGVLPAGVALKSMTSGGSYYAIFSWEIPTNFTPGLYNFTVQVVDNGTPQLSDTKTFGVFVSPGIPVTGGPSLYLPLIRH